MEKNFGLSEKEVTSFCELLSQEAGFSRVNDTRVGILKNSIEARLEKKSFSAREYYDFLKSDPAARAEIRELVGLVTIEETYFFRNEPQFVALKNFVLPEIIQRKIYSPDKSIRVWSAGCSTGDEPYSLAIALMETLPVHEKWNVSILATDISKESLEKAKRAVYGKRATSQLPVEYVGRYFKKEDGAYVLSEEVKKMVKFEQHNLFKDPYVRAGMMNLDIIFCRNVTIYFDVETTKNVIDKFYECLADDGYLFIGHAETLWGINESFESVEFPQTFVYKKTTHPVSKVEKIKPFIGIPEIKLEKTVLPGPSEPTEERYSRAVVLANQAKYTDAAGELEKIVKIDNLHARAYYLLGVIFNKKENFKEAEENFKKCLYIRPDMAVAYYNIGSIYLYQQRFALAEKEFRNAEKILKEKQPDSVVEFCENLTVGILLRACEKSIEKINFLRSKHE